MNSIAIGDLLLAVVTELVEDVFHGSEGSVFRLTLTCRRLNLELANKLIFDVYHYVYCRFVGGPLKHKMDAHLKTKLGNVVYTAETAPEICKQICNEIQVMAKEMQYDRYKYIVTCDICEAKGQSFRVSSRSVWDTKTDVCISSSFKNKTLIAVATVFAMYYE